MTNAAATSSAAARWQDYVQLLKPRVMSLVVFTGATGLICADRPMNLVLATVAIFCIAVGAGASAAFNMWFDADIDAMMSRTRARPVPSGKVQGADSLAMGITLTLLSCMVMWLAVGLLAASLLAFTIFFYAVVYPMWLKRSTPQNIVIGGAAGAFPPMVGWAAVTGTITLPSIVLFLIIFLWTPPHFWALALYKQGDYGAAGIPMLPNVKGEPATKQQILLYSGVLVAASLLPFAIGMSGRLYALVAAGLGAGFIYLAWRLFRSGDAVPMKKQARALFTYSLSYLFVIFLALMVDHAVQVLGWLQ